MNYKLLVLLTLFLFPVAYGSTIGNISLSTTQNGTAVVTGVWGSSFNFYCSTGNTCQSGDKCLLDYDSFSATFAGNNYAGWCVSTSETSCIHNGTYTATGGKTCDGGAARSCSSGNWTTTSCNSNQTCSAGECVTSSSSSSSSSSGSGSGNSTSSSTTSNPSGITVSSVPANFDIVQGESVIKDVTVKNSGNITLPAISLAISGIDWYSVTPGNVSLVKNTSTTFSVNFTIPETAEVKEYVVTVTAQNGSLSSSSSFNIRVLPSNKTVESTILPLYDEYKQVIIDLENNITELEGKGADVTELRSMLNSIKEKLSQAGQSIDSQDYFTASTLLNEVKTLIDDFKIQTANTSPPPPAEFNWLFVIVPVALGIIAVIAYLFWPVKEKALSILKPGK